VHVLCHGRGTQPTRRVALWPKAVDTSEFDPRFASTAMRDWLSHGHAQSPLFLYVGRLSPEKGIETLRPLLEAIPDSRLAIIGGGPSRKALETHYAGTATFFAGYLTGRRLAEAMASATALILPSKTETLGLVLMEGMAAGSVMVGANAGGIPDVIQHEVNGSLYDPDRDGDLARVACRVATEPVFCGGIRANARLQAEQWSWTAATRQLLRFYEAAMAMPRFQKSERAKAPWMLAMKRAMVGGMKIFLSWRFTRRLG
jgi:glycosyltransferase involved in cell wall biosynthesis